MNVPFVLNFQNGEDEGDILFFPNGRDTDAEDEEGLLGEPESEI